MRRSSASCSIPGCAARAGGLRVADIDFEHNVAVVMGKDAGRALVPSAGVPLLRSIATCVSALNTGKPSTPPYGWACWANDPQWGLSSRGTARTRPGWVTSTPTASDTRSPINGSPLAAGNGPDAPGRLALAFDGGPLWRQCRRRTCTRSA